MTTQPWTYPARVAEPAPGQFLATFPDIPEAVTGGGSREEALHEAADALAAAVEGLLEQGRAVPDPRLAGSGEIAIALAPALAARVALQRAMAEQRLSKTALSQRMRRDEKTIRRILAGRNVSLDLTLEALKAVGVRPALAFPPLAGMGAGEP